MQKGRIRRIFSVVMAVIMTTVVLSGCHTDSLSSVDNDRMQIVATIFPEYDWVMNILGENPANAEVTLLLDQGVDLHSYQPTTADILKISTCDVFLYVGGESDEWVEDAVAEAVNKDIVAVNLLDVLGDSVHEEEIVEGMEAEEEEGEEEPEYDEHVWLSLKNAGVLVDSIAEAVSKADPTNAGVYRDNANKYKDKLTDLDGRYKSQIESASKKSLLFGDRFPFRYMTEDYGLTYYAAFAGCSAETEASFETVTFLAQKTDELSLSAVLTIDGSDQRIAETIVENTKTKDQKILTLDSMQSVTREDIEGGKTYLSIMEDNLKILTEALQ